MATIKTRILLPTKTAAEWESSDRVLSAGELALVTDDNGGFKLIAGDGKTYGEGVRELEAGSTTAHYEVTDLAQLSGVYNNGDTAVVKKILAEGKDPSYTAYVYDGALSAWKAMDGNYSSDNVYFEEDIVKAGSWTGVGNISHTANKVETLTTAGLSLTEVMDKIFKGNEAYPTKPTPSCGITQTAKSVEVGTTVTPAFTLSFDAKKYAYGSNTNTALNSTTGVTAATYILTYTDKDNTTKTLTGNWTTSVTASESYNVKAGNNNGTAYLSVVYNAAADGTYIPRSNLERVLSSATELTKYRVAGGTATTSNASNKIVGYYPNFYGFRD